MPLVLAIDLLPRVLPLAKGTDIKIVVQNTLHRHNGPVRFHHPSNIDFPNDDDWLKIQFQFLINEMPVTDTSKKVKSVIKRRQADGKLR